MLSKVTNLIKGTSLVVQWLRHHSRIAGGTGLIPGWGTKIPALRSYIPLHEARAKKKKIKGEKKKEIYQGLEMGTGRVTLCVLG